MVHFWQLKIYSKSYLALCGWAGARCSSRWVWAGWGACCTGRAAPPGRPSGSTSGSSGNPRARGPPGPRCSHGRPGPHPRAPRVWSPGADRPARCTAPPWWSWWWWSRCGSRAASGSWSPGWTLPRVCPGRWADWSLGTRPRCDHWSSSGIRCLLRPRSWSDSSDSDCRLRLRPCNKTAHYKLFMRGEIAPTEPPRHLCVEWFS